jgi:thiamine pyrophosphate-dependent acetolactate synthase large subunit-like protein
MLRSMPPHLIVMGTGREDDAYHEIGERYRTALGRENVEVRLLPTAGSAENLAMLRDPHSAVSVALIEGGILGVGDASGVESLATVFYEPLWWFHRREVRAEGADALRGQKISIGPEGSGTQISHALVEAGVEFISARHEGNAASMADAYAKATGELTLVSVHSGPGLTNAITGIGEAAKSRTPLLVLAGDVPTGAVKSNFYIDQAELVKSVGAVSERIHTPLSAREDTLRAVTRALRDRQTVVLSLPLDVQDARLNGSDAPLDLPPAPGRLHPDPEDVRPLAGAMARAQRPLILAGRGAVLSDAEEALVALADRSGALLATSVCGHGLFAENPWSLGISGGFSSPIANELITESDLILGFGVSFTQWTTKKGKLIAPGATIAQIDIEAPKLGYQMPVQHAVLGDARATAEALLAELGRRHVSSPKPGRRSDRTRERIRSGDNHHSPHPDESNAQFIDPRTLSKILPKDRVVASDSGHFCGWVPRYLRVPNPRASCLSPFVPVRRTWRLALANPGKLAVLGAGDGGWRYALAV